MDSSSDKSATWLYRQAIRTVQCLLERHRILDQDRKLSRLFDHQVRYRLVPIFSMLIIYPVNCEVN